jgi:hypothetical protein
MFSRRLLDEEAMTTADLREYSKALTKVIDNAIINVRAAAAEKDPVRDVPRRTVVTPPKLGRF